MVITVVVSVCSKRKAAQLLFGFGLLLGGAPGRGDGAARVEPAIGKLLLVSRLHSTGAIRTLYKISLRGEEVTSSLGGGGGGGQKNAAA